MTRQIRTCSRPRDFTAEIDQFTSQLQDLLRPGERLEPLTLGALAKAKRRYPVRIHAFTFLPDRFRLLATYCDVERMADFMRYFTQKLSKEVGLLRGFKGAPVFPYRYRHAELSQEPAVELDRLRKVLGYACEEGLVDSPLDWTGAASTESLVTGELIPGLWIDRTAYCKAKKNAREEDFIEEMELRLSPLPSLEHLSSDAYRRLMIETVREIERDARQNPRTVPENAEDSGPRKRPELAEGLRSFRIHALSAEIRDAMEATLTWILAAYRDASKRFRAGEYDVDFPAGTFPPARPFVTPLAVPLDSG